MPASNHTHLLDTELSRCVNELTTLQGAAVVRVRTNMTIQQIMAFVVNAFEEDVESVDDLKKLIISNLSNSPLVQRNREKMRKLFNELADEVLNMSATAIQMVSDRKLTSTDAMHLYGLYMIVVKHYKSLRGLRAHVREDMKTFVELFNNSNNALRSDIVGADYMRFFEYHATVVSPTHRDHHDSTKLLLSEMGSDIMRKMLVMGTHLVELVVVWDQIEKLKAAAEPCRTPVSYEPVVGGVGMGV